MNSAQIFGTLEVDGLVATGDASVATTFVGSGTPGLFGVNLDFTATSETLFEAGAQLVLRSDVGASNPVSAGKIGLFVACFGTPGSAAVYGENILADVATGVGDVIVTGSELNINNNNQDYGESSMTSTLGVGYFANSSGPKRLSAAFAVNSPTAVWNRGYTVMAGSVRLTAYEDGSNAQTSYKAFGAHQVGIDLSGSTTMTDALITPNNASISALDSGGVKRGLMTLNSGNGLDLGYDTMSGVGVHGPLVQPLTDNHTALGGAANRWSNGHFVRVSVGAPFWTSGSGSPEGVLAAPVGSLYSRTDGGVGSTLYVKQTGSSTTGWAAK